MNRGLVAVLAACVLAAGCGRRGAEPRDGGELAALQQALARAWVAGDRTAIERIIAPEWKTTGPDGVISDRAAVLADVFDTRRHKMTRMEIDQVETRVHGDAAVVTGRTRAEGEYAGTPYKVVIRFTDTFIYRDGRWQAVASHASLVQ